MVDYIKIKISSGSGGNGAISFRKEKYVPFGGPDGGWGGRGGDAYIVGDEEVRDLGHLSGISEVKAEVGMSGAGSNRVGRDGGDAEVVVLTGTAVVFGTGRSAEKHEVLGNGQRVRVAVGGMGGRGNRAFATSVMKVPRIAESGEKGQAWWVQLHFKTLADIAIVGLANSGKSSLLNRVTGAGVKVADYPMTTVEPVVGVVEHGWRQYRPWVQ